MSLTDDGCPVTAAADEMSDNTASQQLMESGNFLALFYFYYVHNSAVWHTF